jgi:hypothetical protein
MSAVDRTKPHWLAKWGLPEYEGSDGSAGVGQRQPFVTSDGPSDQKVKEEIEKASRDLEDVDREL